jgi:hypothetical protein
MHNFMSYDRSWLDEPSIADHVGRAIWSLGRVLEFEAPSSFDFAVAELLDHLVADLDPDAISPRTAAYVLLGLARPELAKRHDELSSALADRLVVLHAERADPAWDWFEPSFRYDNARLSQSLIVTGGSMCRPELTELGLRTLHWYGDQCGVSGTLRLPGNAGRRRDEPHPGRGDEQPLDAAALVEAEIDALSATGDPIHGRRALAAFEWFTGRNHLGASLYDSSTGGCCDGLASDGVNLNQGAESTLAYYTARLAIEAAGLPVIARRHARSTGSAHEHELQRTGTVHPSPVEPPPLR